MSPRLCLWAIKETVAVMSPHLAGHIPGLSPECPASGLTGSWKAGSGHLWPLTKCRLEPGGKVGEASLMPTHSASDLPGCSSYPNFWGLFWGQCISRWWLSLLPGALLGFWSCLQNSSALLAQPEVQVWDGLVVCVGLGEWVECSGKHLSNESRGSGEGFFF